MKFKYVIERCKVTGDYTGHIPEMSGAHSCGETLEELKMNMVEVMEMILEDGVPETDSELLGTDEIEVAVHARTSEPHVSGGHLKAPADGVRANSPERVA